METGTDQSGNKAVEDLLYHNGQLRYNLESVNQIKKLQEKIENLDDRLHNFTKMTIDMSEDEEEDEDYMYKELENNKRPVVDKEKEAKEMNAFAGIFSSKTALTQDKKPLKLKFYDNQKKYEQWRETIRQRSYNRESSKPEKPKLVELHSYPGYESNYITELPENISASSQLRRIADGRNDLKKMTKYRTEFVKLFHSEISEAIMQDVFWWFFLHRYQPSKNTQDKIFNRIASNYVKLLAYAKNPLYRDVFFKTYPDLICQAVYSTYCEAFPTSWRQYDDKFKTQLTDLVTLWMTGNKPYPRSWANWPYSKLEPPLVQKREAQARHQNVPALDFSITNGLSENSNNRQQNNIHEINEDSHITAKVKERRSSKIYSVSSFPGNITPLPASRRLRDNGTRTTVTKKHHCKKNAALKSNIKRERTQSHPATKGPEFEKSVFNVHGHSPLVEQFMRTKKISTNSGPNFYIRRTDINKLPPVDAETYQDVIRNSIRTAHFIERHFDRFTKSIEQDQSNFALHQHGFNLDYKKRQEILLAQPLEVKRLSEILLLEASHRENIDCGTYSSSALRLALEKIQLNEKNDNT